MKRRKFYSVRIANQDFRVYRISKGWAAKTRAYWGAWRSVRRPYAGRVWAPTRKQMIEYLKYAYGGESK